MGVILVRQNNNYTKYVTEGFVDTRDEMLSLSTDFTPGSIFYVIEDDSIWVLNSKKIWKELGIS